MFDILLNAVCKLGNTVTVVRDHRYVDEYTLFFEAQLNPLIFRLNEFNSVRFAKAENDNSAHNIRIISDFSFMSARIVFDTCHDTTPL